MRDITTLAEWPDDDLIRITAYLVNKRAGWTGKDQLGILLAEVRRRGLMHRFRSGEAKTYLATQCSEPGCTRTPLYRAGGKVACKVHKHIVEHIRVTRRNQYEAGKTERERARLLETRDELSKRNLKRAKTFRKRRQ